MCMCVCVHVYVCVRACVCVHTHPGETGERSTLFCFPQTHTLSCFGAAPVCPKEISVPQPVAYLALDLLTSRENFGVMKETQNIALCFRLKKFKCWVLNYTIFERCLVLFSGF